MSCGVQTQTITIDFTYRRNFITLDFRNKIAVATMWDIHSSQSILNKYISFNSLLTASVGSTIDACFDVFNIPQLKSGATTPPASITPDFCHFTKLGQSYVVPVYVAALRTLLL